MSESRDYIKRLEALNGRPLENLPDDKQREEIRRIVRKKAAQAHGQPAERPKTAVEPVQYKRDIPVSQPRTYRAPDGSPIALEEALKGAEITCSMGRAYLIDRRMDKDPELCDQFPFLCDQFAGGFCDVSCNLQSKLAELCKSENIAPEDLLFVDLETTGLGNSPLFLVGTMLWENDSLVVKQYLARDYSEEAAVTSLFAEELAGRKLLVSFNGKTFDFPYLKTRAAALGIKFPYRFPHFDLLHESRRHWKHSLPNCRLQTLERHICGRTRSGDIPGHEIPEAYHTFVRTSNAVQMVEVIKHNMLDLVTMADLMVHIRRLG